MHKKEAIAREWLEDKDLDMVKLSEIKEFANEDQDLITITLYLIDENTKFENKADLSTLSGVERVKEYAEYPHLIRLFCEINVFLVNILYTRCKQEELAKEILGEILADSEQYISNLLDYGIFEDEYNFAVKFTTGVAQKTIQESFAELSQKIEDLEDVSIDGISMKKVNFFELASYVEPSSNTKFKVFLEEVKEFVSSYRIALEEVGQSKKVEELSDDEIFFHFATDNYLDGTLVLDESKDIISYKLEENPVDAFRFNLDQDIKMLELKKKESIKQKADWAYLGLKVGVEVLAQCIPGVGVVKAISEGVNQFDLLKEGVTNGINTKDTYFSDANLKALLKDFTEYKRENKDVTFKEYFFTLLREGLHQKTIELVGRPLSFEDSVLEDFYKQFMNSRVVQVAQMEIDMSYNTAHALDAAEDKDFFKLQLAAESGKKSQTVLRSTLM